MGTVVKMTIMLIVCMMTACMGINNITIRDTPIPEMGAEPDVVGTAMPSSTPEIIAEPNNSDEPIATPSPATPRLILDEKWQALSAIMARAAETSDLIKRAKLQAEWLETVFLLSDEIQNAELDGYDTLCLARLGRLLDYTPNFIWADELADWDLIVMLKLYYNDGIDMNVKSYMVEGKDYTLPEVMYDRRDGAYIIEAATANRFFQSVLGFNYPEKFGDYCDDYGFYYRQKGTFYVPPADYDTPIYYLSGYRYLGGSLYLMAFDVGYRYLEESADFEFVRDAKILLTQKNDSLWGFNVISQFKGGRWCNDIDLPVLNEIEWIRIERVKTP